MIAWCARINDSACRDVRVCVCMYAFIFVRVFECVRLCVHVTHTHTLTHNHTLANTHTHTQTHSRTLVRVCVCVHVCQCVSVCAGA